MRKILLAAALLLPLPALAEHMDVIEFKLKEECSVSEYMEIVADFNKWGKSVGYQAKVAVPVQSNNLVSWYWLGTSANAATFGKAWDTWRDAMGNPDSTPANLQARFAKCSENIARRGYDVY